jgi:hypothetical protein
MNENIQTNQQPVNQAPVQGPTKKCKHCQSDIPKKAKVCPVCRKKQGGKLKWIIIIIIALFIIGSIGGKNSNSDSSKSDTSTSSSTPSATVETQEPEIEYTAVDVSTMMDDLNNNALKAEETYKDQYLEITGRLAVIDSKGKYISVFSKNDDFAIVGVQCYIKDDATKDKVMEMAKDDTVTLKVHITDVGEVLGYQADIIEVE